MPNNSVSILIAGAMIAAALLLSLMVDRFQLAGGFTVDGMPGIWRMNTRNGSVTPCLLLHDPDPRAPKPAEQYYAQCRN